MVPANHDLPGLAYSPLLILINSSANNFNAGSFATASFISFKSVLDKPGISCPIAVHTYALTEFSLVKPLSLFFFKVLGISNVFFKALKSSIKLTLAVAKSDMALANGLNK